MFAEKVDFFYKNCATETTLDLSSIDLSQALCQSEDWAPSLDKLYGAVLMSTNLQVLNLSNTCLGLCQYRQSSNSAELSGDHIASLVLAFARQPLHTLLISCNNLCAAVNADIDGVGIVEALTLLIKENKNLRRVDVRNNDFTPEQFAALADAVFDNAAIEQLWCDIREDYDLFKVQKIKSKLASLTSTQAVVANDEKSVEDVLNRDRRVSGGSGVSDSSSGAVSGVSSETLGSREPQDDTLAEKATSRTASPTGLGARAQSGQSLTTAVSESHEFG